MMNDLIERMLIALQDYSADNDYISLLCIEAREYLAAAPQPLPLTSDKLKAAFLAVGGSEEAWLDLPGSWFTEGYRSGITAKGDKS